ncbi:54S ribosomal protein L36, mitochondrial [Cytospora mali]|uniref:54S ribosomal protein L36, mitochondrial n=1 Tax=Cytospora mali TaxID=578113 RepID=A0A194VIQ0_CYTMA|nr:54S ribosomal protein L36, mitochondrial [Valsa mali]
MAKLPSALLQRSLPSSSSPMGLLSTTTRPAMTRPSRTPAAAAPSTQQVRHATEIVRPKRPYTFTQVVQLSDGSTYTTRSTSPLPVYRSTKDTRNHLTWQPSESSLKNVELDEAGKLASFRGRFGTQYDLGEDPVEEEGAGAGAGAGAVAVAVAKTDGKGEAKAKAKAGGEGEGEGESKVQSDTDSFAELMASYVRDEPSLKGGQVASNRVTKKGKKK